MRAASSKPATPPLFFAFPDGIFDYVCAECSALCCKGHGFAASLERDMRRLVVRYPQLETMVVARDGDTVELLTPDSGCLMLDPDNLCRIEKDLGKDNKPNVCKIFPFNSFTKVGKTVVVLPHFLCPLRLILPAQTGSVEGSHARIADQIRRAQILDNPGYLKNLVPAAAVHSSVSDSQALKREEDFRELCARALGVRRFSEVLLSASRRPELLTNCVRRASRILGYEMQTPWPVPDALDAMLLAFASVYRIGVLDLEGEQILRALAVAELMVRRTWSATARIPTLQAVVQTIVPFKPIHVLLANGDDAFDFGKLSNKTFTFRDPEMIFAAFIFAREAGTCVMGALERAIPAEMTIANRSALLRRLGEVMHTVKQKRLRKHRSVVDKILSGQDKASYASGKPL